MQGERGRRAALGLRFVWLVPCMPHACAAHSQESQQLQDNPCRSAALPLPGSAHPSQVQAWLCRKGRQLSSSSPEWSVTDVERERYGFTLSSRLPDCSLVTLDTWCGQPPDFRPSTTGGVPRLHRLPDRPPGLILLDHLQGLCSSLQTLPDAVC